MKATVGRMVHFYSKSRPPSSSPAAAVIGCVHTADDDGGGVVSLVVFDPFTMPGSFCKTCVRLLAPGADIDNEEDYCVWPPRE